MKVETPALVTGASGFIGRHLVRSLLAQDRPVLALCRSARDMQDYSDRRLKIVVGRMEDVESLKPQLHKEVTVFHLAAARAKPGSRADVFEKVNEVATLKLGRAALEANVRKFVHVSTALVFGPSEGEQITEESTWDWRTLDSHYIRSRENAQSSLKKLVAEGLPLTVVCPTIVFGPDHPTHPNRLTNQIRRLLRLRIDMVIGGGDVPRNLVHVEDVVKGILLAETYEGLDGIFILGGHECSHREFNRTVLSSKGIRPSLTLSIPQQLVHSLARMADMARGFSPGSGYRNAVQMLSHAWRFSSRKAERVLGYHAMPFVDAIQNTISSIEGTDNFGTSHQI